MSENIVYIPPKFQPMPKMARLNKQVLVTEKIDGSNAQIHIEEYMPYSGCELEITKDILVVKVWEDGRHWFIRAGSKNRYLTAEDDNFGFAKWVIENGVDLLGLGLGIHRGEWWGKGIQRGYGLEERRFSLFNVTRWHDTHSEHPKLADTAPDGKVTIAEDAPKCCHVVPLIGIGEGFEGLTEGLQVLKSQGSFAVPGYMNPEGLVAFHTGSNFAFKATIENDMGKWSEKPLLEVANG